MPIDSNRQPPDDLPETLESEFLERIRFEFGELLNKTPPVRVEEFLVHLPAEYQSRAVPELLQLDLAWADDWGLSRTSCDEYEARLPEFRKVVRAFFAELESHDSLAALEDTGELPAAEATLRWRRGLYLGNYELLDPLGQGGFGEVWRARNHSDGGLVAIKSVGPTRRSGALKSNETVVKHNHALSREREMLQELSGRHLRVPRYLDEGRDGSGRPYVVMEYLPALDLQRQREQGIWDWQRCVRVTISVAEALRDLHRLGYYHCDLKMRNIVVDGDDQAWLIDLGSTMRYRDVVHRGRGYYPPFTRGYAPPEAELADNSTQINARYDLHMLGAVLYALLTGRPPGPEETQLRQRYNAPDERIEPQPPSEIHTGVPGSLDDVVLWMLQKSTTDRPHNAQEVIDRLRFELERGTVATGNEVDGPAAHGQTRLPTRDGAISSTAKVSGGPSLVERETAAKATPGPAHLLQTEKVDQSKTGWGRALRAGLMGLSLLGGLLYGALAVVSPGESAAPGNATGFELGPKVRAVQGQFAPLEVRRVDDDRYQAFVESPYQLWVGQIKESQRPYEVSLKFDVSGPVIDLGLTFGFEEHLTPMAITTWWMLHLDRQASDSLNLAEIDWALRIGQFTLTNPIPQQPPLTDRVAEGTLIWLGSEPQRYGVVRMDAAEPNLRVTLRVSEGRIVAATINGTTYAIQMPEEAPPFTGELCVLLGGAAQERHADGRPRAPGQVMIHKPTFCYLD